MKFRIITLTICIIILMFSIISAPECGRGENAAYIRPKLLYEIKDNPAVGFFQRVITGAMSEKDGTLYVLAGTPDGVYVYHGDNGSPLRKFQLDKQLDPADRIRPCGKRIWFVRDKQLFELTKDGKLATPKDPLSPMPESVGDVFCDPADRTVLVDGSRTELRRYDGKGTMDLRIGPPKINEQQAPDQIESAEPAPFSSIRSLAIDGFGRIFVLDSRARAVFPFDQKGRPMKPITGDKFSNTDFPYDAPSIAIDSDRNIWVVNPSENTIDAYSLFGSMIKRIESAADNGFLFVKPVEIFIDSHDRLYIIDRAPSISVVDISNK